MVDKTDSEMLETLKCPLCLDFAENAMECVHCNNIFCKKCLGIDQILSKIKLKSCPICRAEPTFKDCYYLLGDYLIIYLLFVQMIVVITPLVEK